MLTCSLRRDIKDPDERGDGEGLGIVGETAIRIDDIKNLFSIKEELIRNFEPRNFLSI